MLAQGTSTYYGCLLAILDASLERGKPSSEGNPLGAVAGEPSFPSLLARLCAYSFRRRFGTALSQSLRQAVLCYQYASL